MKIYISSTFEDLKEHRKAVYNQLRKLRLDTIAMEDYVPGENRPLAQCLQDVEEADVYVGLFAWRYGHIPAEYNPEQRSITELEYHAAGNHKKERLIFMLRDETPWSPNLMDSHTNEGDEGRQIKRFRSELINRHTVGFFSTPDELAKEVSAAISSLRSRDTTTNRNKLAISDIQLSPDKQSKICIIDFRVFNPTGVDIQINRIKFEVIDVFEVHTLGFMEFSQLYDLDISSLVNIGDTITCNVSQVLKSGEVDRFGIRVIATQLGTGVFRGWNLRPALMTNVGDFPGPCFEVWLPYCLQDDESLKETRDRYEAKRRKLDEMVRRGKK